MSNHHLRNKELSLKAKGLLSQMLSLPEDWDYTLAGLSHINREKIDAIREAVKELEKAGYIVRSRERDEKGRLRGADYVIYEQPQPREPEAATSVGQPPILDLPALENPTLENPTLEKPTQEKPTLENPTQLNKDISSKEKSITDLSSTHSFPFHSLNPLPFEQGEAASPPERKRTEAKSNSAVEIYREIIKDNIEYDILIQDPKMDKDRLNEIVDLMLETVCTARKTIRIAGDDYPADFKGHSLSVSDIVVLHQNDEDTAHYVDSIGFQQVPEFLQEQQTPVFDKLPPEQQQALSDTVQDTLQMLVDADKRIYGDVTGKTLEAIAAQGYSYKDGQLEKQQPEATPDSLLTGETVRTPRGNFHITDMSREQIEAAGFGFHHASEDGKYLIMGNGTQAYAIAAEQPQRDNPLKHVEDTIEQNDNNFDGLINNTPQTPTVADFEQRAKAGEAISVTDLAKAVKAEKREQPQKKPSILKKLDEYKKQAAQQPKDKQKEHKKDLEV